MEKPSFTIPKVRLNSAAGALVMPVIGLGTSADPLDEVVMKAAVIEGLRLGYRQFDTASKYGSEVPLGEAIDEALGLGIVRSREELFVTSKLWCSDSHADRVVPALKESLRKLGLEYLDLYLVHWPISCKPGPDVHHVDEEDLMPMDFESVWGAMEECQRLGLTKSIGVSNFTCKKLGTILIFATIPPSVNQVEMNPVWQQKKGRTGGPTWSWRTRPSIQEIAEARGKSVAQVCLRWIYEQGATAVVKSFNKGRMRENLGIFDWELSEDELERIGRIPQKRMLPKEKFVSPTGPYKSLDELWDGEF
ncbi:hypothetical protein SAY86_019930 [Trapa natans]|uniref:NADP-dependent oxidoreductase domain-containing protein n=1 Tax=Trapa natans TaxID=22666 RepID=A0AAN7R617_TRANT|nr:hypothetical protein SAY86_019930 [Trapa natans]